MGWPIEGEQLTLGNLDDTRKLSHDEQHIVDLFQGNDLLTMEELTNLSGFSLAKTASILFNLEMETILRALPGHAYQLIHR
jgi:hypothetical protein